MIAELSYVQRYPLAPAGGLFLLVVGVGLVLGGIVPRRRTLLLASSGGFAVTTLVLFAGRITAPYGVPTPLQVWSLVASVAFEVVALSLVIRLFRARGERTLYFLVFLVVGAHFVPMAPAFGPVVALLGVLAMLNALVGLRSSAHSLRALFLVDGALKAAAGGLLWLVVPEFPL
jgi:hypothetical protein